MGGGFMKLYRLRVLKKFRDAETGDMNNVGDILEIKSLHRVKHILSLTDSQGKKINLAQVLEVKNDNE